VPFSEVDTVRNTPGIDSQRFLPIAVDQSQFSQSQSERFMNNGLIQMQTSAVIFGIDIDEAFGKRPDGSRPMIELPFQEGTLSSAMEKLKTGGRYCLIPDSFAFRADVHVGDKLELVLPKEDRRGGGEEQIVEYEVCGIVSIHGWLWMNKISGVRKRGYRSGAMLLAPYETVKNDYRLKDAAYFWFDRTLDASGKPTVSDAVLEQSLQQLADRQTAQTDGVSRPMVKVSSRNYLRERVGDRADEVIQAAAKMPLILLAISCFGMMGTIAASVRSRRFELGILRSLGVTRFRLIRLILAEAVLIAIVVIVVSVGFGVIAGWCFIGLMKYVAGFGGFTSPLTIPMYHLALGFMAAMGCCFLAALGPAVAAGRTAPTRLLQERV
jgi:putative ABC transport system permease protein